MSYFDVVINARENNILLSALLELTYRCNLDCYFCYNDRDLSGQPLSFEQYTQLLEELAEMGVLHLALSGGEPLAHPEFFAIGAKARELGFAVRIKSNGHALRSRLARRIRDEIDPAVIELSLHGSCAATHDRQTRIAGSFERLLDNIDEMQRLGLRIDLNCPVTQWNEAEVGDIDAIGASRGLTVKFDTHITPRDNGDQEPLDIGPSDAGIRAVMAIERQRTAQAAVSVNAKRSGPPPPARSARKKFCGAGTSTIAVDPYGNVYPCVQWRRPVGNLHLQPVAEIWGQSPELQRTRDDSERVASFVTQLGPKSSVAGFCPGAAEQLTGSPDRLYPTAKRRISIVVV